MSRTYHHSRAKRFWRDYWDRVEELYPSWWRKPFKSPQTVPLWADYNYNKNPSWWNRLFNNCPKRRKAKLLCHKLLTLSPDEQENQTFPLDKKPNKYYW